MKQLQNTIISCNVGHGSGATRSWHVAKRRYAPIPIFLGNGPLPFEITTLLSKNLEGAMSNANAPLITVLTFAWRNTFLKDEI